VTNDEDGRGYQPGLCVDESRLTPEFPPLRWIWTVFCPYVRLIVAMKRISIQDLKAQLSSAVAAAEAGDTILITRHNEPVAQLSPAESRHVHRGPRVGSGRIGPAVSTGTKGRYLAVLVDDRAGR
jgi:prevent-host-death family protein